MHEFNILFDYTFQEGTKRKYLSINRIQSEYRISIDYIDNITKKYSGILGNKDKRRSKVSAITFTVDTSFENTLFMDTPLIG